MRGSFFFCVPLLALVAFCGCRKQPSPEWARQRLTGKYHLGGKECGPGVKSSTLELRSDGTYDQLVEFATGETLNEVGNSGATTAACIFASGDSLRRPRTARDTVSFSAQSSGRSGNWIRQRRCYTFYPYCPPCSLTVSWICSGIL